MTKLAIILPDNLSKKLLMEYLNEKYEISEKGSTINLGKFHIDDSEILNKKQSIVLTYTYEGYKYSEIAKKMDMTIDGVRFYVKAIYKKLNVDNAIKAIRRWQNS